METAGRQARSLPVGAPTRQLVHVNPNMLRLFCASRSGRHGHMGQRAVGAELVADRAAGHAKTTS